MSVWRDIGTLTECYVLTAPAYHLHKYFIIIQLKRLQSLMGVASDWYHSCSPKSVLWHYKFLKEKA